MKHVDVNGQVFMLVSIPGDSSKAIREGDTDRATVVS